MIKKTILVSMILLLVSACGPVSSVPQAWFDQPINGASFPMAPVEITMHAADPGDISQVQLFVNGDLVETIANQFGDTPLVIITTIWTPPAPGKYSLQVRSQSNAGTWSERVATVVLIWEPRSDEVTPEPTSDQGGLPVPLWTIPPSVEPPTSTYTKTMRVIPSSTPTYVRPSMTPTSTYVRPSLTPTFTPTTYVRPSLTPTICIPQRGVICP